MVLLDLSKRKRLLTKPLALNLGSDVVSVAFSPDGKMIAAGGFGKLVLWDVAARKRLVLTETFTAKLGVVQSVAFSPDGNIIAAGCYVTNRMSSDGAVVLWDVAARKVLFDEPFAVKANVVARSVAFSPNSKTIAAGYSFPPQLNLVGGGVMLWDVATRRLLLDKSRSAGMNYRGPVAFSPDGITVAAASRYISSAGNGITGVVLWNLPVDERLVNAPLAVPEGDVESVAFSPDGKTVAAAVAEVSGVSSFNGVVLWHARRTQTRVRRAIRR